MTPPLIALAFWIGWTWRGHHDATARERHAVRVAERILKGVR